MSGALSVCRYSPRGREREQTCLILFVEDEADPVRGGGISSSDRRWPQSLSRVLCGLVELRINLDAVEAITLVTYLIFLTVALPN